MHKLLIADDDMLVRMDLRTLLDWKSLNIELLEDAVDGKDALQKASAANPDILILDVGMPQMDGIEVIKRLKEEGYNGKIVILSCHDDFENVKEAMRLGAFDYVLKHLLKPQDFVGVIKKAIEFVEAEARDREEKKRLVQMTEQSIPILAESFVRDLKSGSLLGISNIEKRLNQIGRNMKFEKYAIILIEIDAVAGIREKLNQEQFNKVAVSMRLIIDEAVKNRDGCITASIDDGKFCIIIDFGDSKSYLGISSEIYAISVSIQNNARNILNVSVSAGISKVFTDVTSVRDCFGQARLALDGKFYLGKGKIIHFSEIENFSNKLEGDFKDFENDLYALITSGSQEINKFIENMFKVIKERNVKSEHIRMLCFELLAAAGRMIKDLNLGYDGVFGREYIPYHCVMTLETLDEIQQWFTGVCVNIIKNNSTNRIAKNIRPEIKKAIEYIEKNYMKDISLQDIAVFSNLSRTYFSQLFKQETSENFVDYLNTYRIKKAKVLLHNSDKKVYEVGMECGFDNYRYFTKTFKEMCGVSPVDYRGGKTSS